MGHEPSTALRGRRDKARADLWTVVRFRDLLPGNVSTPRRITRRRFAESWRPKRPSTRQHTDDSCSLPTTNNVAFALLGPLRNRKHSKIDMI